MDSQPASKRHAGVAAIRRAGISLFRAAVAVLCGAVIAAVASGGWVEAAEWPSRPIKVIAPSTPGGAADTFARLLAEFLSPQLHQPGESGENFMR